MFHILYSVSDPLLEFQKALEKRGERKVFSRSRSRSRWVFNSSWS